MKTIFGKFDRMLYSYIFLGSNEKIDREAIFSKFLISLIVILVSIFIASNIDFTSFKRQFSSSIVEKMMNDEEEFYFYVSHYYNSGQWGELDTLIKNFGNRGDIVTDTFIRDGSNISEALAQKDQVDREQLTACYEECEDAYHKIPENTMNYDYLKSNLNKVFDLNVEKNGFKGLRLSAEISNNEKPSSDFTINSISDIKAFVIIESSKDEFEAFSVPVRNIQGGKINERIKYFISTEISPDAFPLDEVSSVKLVISGLEDRGIVSANAYYSNVGLRSISMGNIAEIETTFVEDYYGSHQTMTVVKSNKDLGICSTSYLNLNRGISTSYVKGGIEIFFWDSYNYPVKLKLEEIQESSYFGNNESQNDFPTISTCADSNRTDRSILN